MAPASALAALPDVQEVEVDAQGRNRQVAGRYAAAVLDRLDALRIDVINGQVSPARLLDLAEALRAERPFSQDPRLDELVDEIALRAEVEMAKFGLSSLIESGLPESSPQTNRFNGEFNSLLQPLRGKLPLAAVRLRTYSRRAPTEALPPLLTEMTVTLPPHYWPSDDEPFMNPRMLEYFRPKLLHWRAELVEEADRALHRCRTAALPSRHRRPASAETNRALELRTRDRARKLIAKIDEALERIDNDTYGYCEETHEPISISRLEARPIATLSLEAQDATSAWKKPTAKSRREGKRI